MKREELDPKYIKIELNIRPLRHLLHSFEADYGRDELIKFMNMTGLPVEYFDNEYNWVSYEYYINLFKELVKYTGDQEIVYKYGLNAVKYADAWGIWKPILTMIASPIYIIKTVVKLSPRYGKFGETTLLESRKNMAVIRSQLNKGYKPDINNCLHVKGQYASIPTYFGLPPAKIRDIQCASEGADSCIFEMTWQDFPFNKRKFLPLLFSLPVALIIIIILALNIISALTLAKIGLLLLPIAFFLAGYILDYKRAIRDNSKIADEQNQSIIDAIDRNQVINEELQITIDKRTEELKAVNKKLDTTLIQVDKTEKKLKLMERLTGIANLAAGVAHEINNPMGAVRNYLQDILEEMPESDPRRRDILEAERATKDSKDLINSLLSFARMDDNLLIIEININEVLNTILMNTQQTSPGLRIKVNKEFDPELPVLHSDPMQINQAFTNLILNSYNAIRGKGEINIKTSAKGDLIHVDIADNGEIIPEYMLDKLFDPAEKQLYGVGRKDLGLAISYSIIRRFNGDIKIKSTIDNGTSFNVMIPYN